MNTLLKVKNNILAKSWDNKIAIATKEIMSKDSTSFLSHNNGKVIREDTEYVSFEHEFVPGIYLRRMSIKKESLVISVVHKRDHAWFLLKGFITITTDKGPEDYHAPYVGFSESGVQRIVYANEDSLFQNIFKNPTDSKDLDYLELYNFSLTRREYNEYIKTK